MARGRVITIAAVSAAAGQCARMLAADRRARAERAQVRRLERVAATAEEWKWLAEHGIAPSSLLVPAVPAPWKP